MVKGSTLLGYDKQEDKKKFKLSSGALTAIIIGTSPLWALVALIITTAVLAITVALTITFALSAFTATAYFFYSIFELMDSLWISIMRMGAALIICGLIIILTSLLFKGVKLFFSAFKLVYRSVRHKIMLMKLEEHKHDENA